MFRPDSRQKLQKDLLEIYLEDIMNSWHELVILCKRIDWSACEDYYGPMYASNSGRPAMPVRLQVGLQLLKHICGLSDLEALKHWTDPPPIGCTSAMKSPFNIVCIVCPWMKPRCCVFVIGLEKKGLVSS